MTCTGIMAKMGSSFLMVLSAEPNLAMSPLNWATSSVGNTFDQKFSPLPKLILHVGVYRCWALGSDGVKGYALHINLRSFESEHSKHAKRVGKHGATSLYTVINVRSAVSCRVDVDGGGHAASHGLLVEHGHLEHVWVLAECISGGHPRRSGADDADTFRRGSRGRMVVAEKRGVVGDILLQVEHPPPLRSRPSIVARWTTIWQLACRLDHVAACVEQQSPE